MKNAAVDSYHELQSMYEIWALHLNMERHDSLVSSFHCVASSTIVTLKFSLEN